MLKFSSSTDLRNEQTQTKRSLPEIPNSRITDQSDGKKSELEVNKSEKTDQRYNPSHSSPAHGYADSHQSTDDVGLLKAFVNGGELLM